MFNQVDQDAEDILLAMLSDLVQAVAYVCDAVPAAAGNQFIVNRLRGNMDRINQLAHQAGVVPSEPGSPAAQADAAAAQAHADTLQAQAAERQVATDNMEPGHTQAGTDAAQADADAAQERANATPPPQEPFTPSPPTP